VTISLTRTPRNFSTSLRSLTNGIKNTSNTERKWKMPKLALDLSGADTSGFPTLPAGTYEAVVAVAEMEETQGGADAKLPAGTPMLAVEFRVTEEGEVESHDGSKFEMHDKPVWRRFVIAPAKVGGKNYEHKAKMDGILYRFLEAVGYDADEIASGEFELDTDDLAGRACRIVVARREYQGSVSNEVKGVKPAGVASGLI
jgi:hypothetical protein